MMPERFGFCNWTPESVPSINNPAAATRPQMRRASKAEALPLVPLGAAPDHPMRSTLWTTDRTLIQQVVSPTLCLPSSGPARQGFCDRNCVRLVRAKAKRGQHDEELELG